MAEESDLILEIGNFTLRESIRQLAEWRRDGLVVASTTMAVNLSVKQFSDRHLVNTVNGKLKAYNLPAPCLELEVTEGVLIQNGGAALKVLEQLKKIGVSLAPDDFGTGYSSLSYLQRFPFDSLKIDRSFISGIESNDDTAAITEAIIALGRALKLQTVAEGIETPEQATKVQAMGCRYAQGYLFSRPLPAETMRDLLSHRIQLTQIFAPPASLLSGSVTGGSLCL
ncbi:MAG: EAL domain-containing protein [Janthinobacterium lividum]